MNDPFPKLRGRAMHEQLRDGILESLHILAAHDSVEPDRREAVLASALEASVVSPDMVRRAQEAWRGELGITSNLPTTIRRLVAYTADLGAYRRLPTFPTQEVIDTHLAQIAALIEGMSAWSQLDPLKRQVLSVQGAHSLCWLHQFLEALNYDSNRRGHYFEPKD